MAAFLGWWNAIMHQDAARIPGTPAALDGPARLFPDFDRRFPVRRTGGRVLTSLGKGGRFVEQSGNRVPRPGAGGVVAGRASCERQQ
jgi:hypothetical protein